MKNKICVITGVTSGMGLATSIALAGMGATLALVCRNKSKGEAVVKTITGQTKNNNITLFVADLSSQAEIRMLAAQLNEKYPHIDVLVNNAGAINKDYILTVDGIETTFAVNHLAYFLLTNLLLEKLKAAPKARIINFASMASMFGKINFVDLNLEKGYSSWKAYSQSKLANIIFTYELAKKLENSNVTANCLHPGVVKTRFGKELKGFFGFVFKKMEFFMRTAEKGAETAIWLASSAEVEGITGKYFQDKKAIKSKNVSYNAEVQHKLWEVSEKLTNLNS